MAFVVALDDCVIVLLWLLLFVLLADDADNEEAADDTEEEAGDNEEDELDEDDVTAELLIIVAMEDCCRALASAIEIEPFDEVDEDSDSNFWRNFDVLLFASELFCIFPERLVDEGVFLGVGAGVAVVVTVDELPAASPVAFGHLGCFFFGRYL